MPRSRRLKGKTARVNKLIIPPKINGLSKVIHHSGEIILGGKTSGRTRIVYLREPIRNGIAVTNTVRVFDEELRKALGRAIRP